LKSLYIRVWLTVVVVLALFALASAWFAQRHVNQERERLLEQAGSVGDRVRAMGELISQALPEAHEDRAQQALALRVWSERLRVPLALDDPRGQRIATSASFERRLADGIGPPAFAVALEDGRTLWLMRGAPSRAEWRGLPQGPDGGSTVRAVTGSVRSGSGLMAVLALLFLAVALGAYPVVRRLTRRLESLQRGVERFGSGWLGHRVDDAGKDEVAQLATAFNRAADRIESLVQSHSRLVANASHELRSPLARLKVALSLLQESHDPSVQDSPMHLRLRQEIERNLRELDSLIEELLLSSRLQAQTGNPVPAATFDLLATVAEEAARSGALLAAAAGVTPVHGEERLLRRAVRNLFENAARYGQGLVEAELLHDQLGGQPWAEVRVLDRGPGVPVHEAQRIFEPFYRLPGHAESEGGVGLGLALVRQIAQHHGGQAEVRPRKGGGSCFSIRVPMAVSPPQAAAMH